MVDGAMLDDVLGPGAWLIAREPADGAVALTEAQLVPFAGEIARWLDKRDADAVLVRPDRSVFGTGTPGALRSAWTAVAGDLVH
jgi:3-(3-hydroxy-phenyl)propionate hydroxylase